MEAESGIEFFKDVSICLKAFRHTPRIHQIQIENAGVKNAASSLFLQKMDY